MSQPVKTFNPFGPDLDKHVRIDGSNMTVKEAETQAAAVIASQRGRTVPMPAPPPAPPAPPAVKTGGMRRRSGNGVLDFAIPGLSKTGVASSPRQAMGTVMAQQGVEEAPPESVPQEAGEVAGDPAGDQGSTNDLPNLPLPPDPIPGGPDILALKTRPAIEMIKPMLARLLRAAVAKGGDPSRAPRNPLSLEDPLLNPLTLDTLLTAFYGTAWYGWETETFDSMCHDLTTFGTPMSSENWSKSQAMATLHVTNHPWIDETVFAGIAESLNGVSPDFGVLKPVQPEYAVVAMRLMSAAVPANVFSDRVLKFVAASCVHAGLLVFPDPEHSARIGPIMRRVVARSVTPKDFDDVEAAWNQFVGRGGLSLPAAAIEQLSEEHLADRQIVTGYWIAQYALEQERLLAAQLDQLAAWAQNEA